MKKETILQIIMTEDDDNSIILNINNIAKTNKGKNIANAFCKNIAMNLNYDNLEYVKMKTDTGEVDLKNG